MWASASKHGGRQKILELRESFSTSTKQENLFVEDWVHFGLTLNNFHDCLLSLRSFFKMENPATQLLNYWQVNNFKNPVTSKP
jgi:hypothetical protein